MNKQFWRGRRVLVTGHTGFKGSWLCLWLSSLGAEVHGYALPPPTDPSLFAVARVDQLLAISETADVRDGGALAATVRRVRPEVIFHLAGQPLVRYSYREPVETYAVNVMGTVHLLEAVRRSDCVRAVVSVTTDKCYENREWPWGYRESESLGGHDPYSSSKACSELVTAAYRSSFLAASGVALASARAGNVIGGGDWATDRLLPDSLRSLDNGEVLTIRSPGAIRPWQHVLEPLSGYLALAEALVVSGGQAAEAWNFGPVDDDALPVGRILDLFSARVPEFRWQCDASPQPHEANYLKLDSSKARTRLGWAPRWRLDKALDMTVDWYRTWRQGGDMREVSLAQIAEFAAAATD
jgi:CDP-glucose 4,6-dehydratase